MLYIEEFNIETILPRYQLSYACHFLLPGKEYRVKIKAKNIIGYSDWSSWSDESNSKNENEINSQLAIRNDNNNDIDNKDNIMMIVENNMTLTKQPSRPSLLLPINATATSILFETNLPYEYGSTISSMSIQWRIVETFARYVLVCLYESMYSCQWFQIFLMFSSKLISSLIVKI